ncbi:uncharacterized protein LOC105697883 [Orussus abietinus]|uniref:uncharacterized protein LOC105697883 n=1 Tax=Orussus abietinus TaxID=222816 RepID=UPI00062611A1|nr:uncharacterized protein LOC105697883 [Orussus abietinus]
MGCTAAPPYLARPDAPFGHPAVLVNSDMEDTLPNELRNDFYKNPRIASGLARASWLGEKEIQVLHRESDNIPREKIFSALHNAGFIRR